MFNSVFSCISPMWLVATVLDSVAVTISTSQKVLSYLLLQHDLYQLM